MINVRYVQQNDKGEWEVLRPGDRRAVVTESTEGEAVQRGKRELRRAGGGEIRVINQTGKLVDRTTIAAPARRRKQVSVS